MSDKTTAGRMADAAQSDSGLPYSVMLDAWDRLGAWDRDALFASRDDFEGALSDALTEYEANPRGYVFNAAATLRFADTPVEPTSISEERAMRPHDWDESASVSKTIGVELTPAGQPVWTNF